MDLPFHTCLAYNRFHRRSASPLNALPIPHCLGRHSLPPFAEAGIAAAPLHQSCTATHPAAHALSIEQLSLPLPLSVRRPFAEQPRCRCPPPPLCHAAAAQPHTLSGSALSADLLLKKLLKKLRPSDVLVFGLHTFHGGVMNSTTDRVRLLGRVAALRSVAIPIAAC